MCARVRVRVRACCGVCGVWVCRCTCVCVCGHRPHTVFRRFMSSVCDRAVVVVTHSVQETHSGW